MSRLLDLSVKLETTGDYCPECRARVEHDTHRLVPIPERGMPPKGEYAPEHRQAGSDAPASDDGGVSPSR